MYQNIVIDIDLCFHKSSIMIYKMCILLIFKSRFNTEVCKVDKKEEAVYEEGKTRSKYLSELICCLQDKKCKN